MSWAATRSGLRGWQSWWPSAWSPQSQAGEGSRRWEEGWSPHVRAGERRPEPASGLELAAGRKEKGERPKVWAADMLAGVSEPRLYTLAERPDLIPRLTELVEGSWPEFMLHGDVANELWRGLRARSMDFQWVLHDEDADEAVGL